MSMSQVWGCDTGTGTLPPGRYQDRRSAWSSWLSRKCRTMGMRCKRGLPPIQIGAKFGDATRERAHYHPGATKIVGQPGLLGSLENAALWACAANGDCHQFRSEPSLGMRHGNGHTTTRALPRSSVSLVFLALSKMPHYGHALQTGTATNSDRSQVWGCDTGTGTLPPGRYQDRRSAWSSWLSRKCRTMGMRCKRGLPPIQIGAKFGDATRERAHYHPGATKIVGQPGLLGSLENAALWACAANGDCHQF